MIEENVKKVSFFKRIFLAIKEFEQYGNFAAENLSVAVRISVKNNVDFCTDCFRYLYVSIS